MQLEVCAPQKQNPPSLGGSQPLALRTMLCGKRRAERLSSSSEFSWKSQKFANTTNDSLERGLFANNIRVHAGHACHQQESWPRYQFHASYPHANEVSFNDDWSPYITPPSARENSRYLSQNAHNYSIPNQCSQVATRGSDRYSWYNIHELEESRDSTADDSFSTQSIIDYGSENGENTDCMLERICEDSSADVTSLLIQKSTLQGIMVDTSKTKSKSDPMQKVDYGDCAGNVSIDDDDKVEFLGHDFIPSNWDVICGRGKMPYNHVGNRRLRLLIAMKLDRYIESKKRGVKTKVVDEIVQHIKGASRHGGFVRGVPTHQKGVYHWYSVGSTAARARVGHSIRDCLPESLRTRKKTTTLPSDRANCIRTVEEALVRSSVST